MVRPTGAIAQAASDLHPDRTEVVASAQSEVDLPLIEPVFIAHLPCRLQALPKRRFLTRTSSPACVSSVGTYIPRSRYFASVSEGASPGEPGAAFLNGQFSWPRTAFL
jgi:hypothetical protein